MVRLCLLLGVFTFHSLATVCVAQMAEESIVRESSAVLREIMAVPLNGIPRSMLADAHGIAIVPKVLKGSFVVGARHGRGVLLARNHEGQWHAPAFMSLTGGNIGWQIGVQSTDVILVFKTRKSVEGILAGKFTIGADATAAAGPIGRQAAAATDATLRAEIYSYSRSRGLFAGVSFDGSVIMIDHLATKMYYRPQGPGQPAIVPESALRLTHAVAAYAGTAEAADTWPELVRQDGASEPGVLRGQLAQAAPKLYAFLDDQWKAYLALPSEVFTETQHPTAATLGRVLSQFDAVARDPRYQELAARPEFRSTYGLLQHYQQSLSPTEAKLNLPPPPRSNNQFAR